MDNYTSKIMVDINQRVGLIELHLSVFSSMLPLYYNDLDATRPIMKATVDFLGIRCKLTAISDCLRDGRKEMLSFWVADIHELEKKEKAVIDRLLYELPTDAVRYMADQIDQRQKDARDLTDEVIAVMKF